MAILGDTSEPTSSAEAFSNSFNTFAISLTFPAGGPWRITHAAVWAAGYGASPSAATAVWDSSGNLLTNSGAFTLTQRTFGVSNSDLYNAAVTPYDVAGGTTVKVGFGISPLTSGCFFGKRASGAWRKKDNTSGFPGSMVGDSAGTGGSFGAYITYVAANTAPLAPTLNDPTGGELVSSQTPTLQFTPDDPDGDNHTGYTYQVDDNSDFSSPVESTEVNGTFTDLVPINRVVSTTLTRGTTYWWRVKTKDATNGYGPYSASTSFKIASLPDGALTAPASAQTAELYYNAGSNTTPKIKARWTYSCPDGHAQNRAIVRIYADSAGSPGSLLNTDTFNISGQSADTTYAVTEGTYYHVSVEVRCSFNLSDAESTKHRCRTRWARASYYFDSGSTPLSLSSAADTTGGSNRTIVLEYTATTSSSEPSTWYSSVASAGLKQFFWHRATMFAWGSSPASPTLNSVTWTYSAVGLQLDHWTVASGGSVDVGTFVYGTQSLKHATNGAEQSTWQVFNVPANTNIILSGKIKTLGQPNAELRIQLSDGSSTVASVAATADTDWTRYNTAVFNTGASTQYRVSLRTNATAGASAWFDIEKVEASTVVTPWMPGVISGAVKLDAGGISVDALAGGVFRLRGSDSGGAAKVQLGQWGLDFESDTTSDTAISTKVTGDSDPRLIIEEDGSLRWGPGSGATDTELSRLTSGSGLTLANGDRFEYQSPGCVATRTTTQAITTSTWTPVEFTATDIHDPFGMHDPATNPSRFTVPTNMDGLYLCWASWGMTANATNTRLMHMSINNSTPGSTVRSVQATGDATHQQGLNLLVVQELAAGDYVEFEAWQDSGSDLNVGANAFAGILYVGNE